MRDSSSTYGRSCFAPSAQFRPMASGRAWRTEFQNASVVWPDSVRPEASVIVPEMMIGRSTPGFVDRLSHREDRRLGVQRVEDRLDQQQVDAAFDQRARADRVGRRELIEVDVAERRIVDVRRQRRRAIGRARARRRRSATCPVCAAILVRRPARDLRGRRG